MIKLDLIPFWAKALGVALLAAFLYASGYYHAHTNSLTKIGELTQQVKTYEATDKVKTEALSKLNEDNRKLTEAVKEQTASIQQLKENSEKAKAASERALAEINKKQAAQDARIAALSKIAADKIDASELSKPGVLEELQDCRRAVKINRADGEMR